jgi:hypothetical protein
VFPDIENIITLFYHAHMAELILKCKYIMWFCKQILKMGGVWCSTSGLGLFNTDVAALHTILKYQHSATISANDTPP